MLRLANRRRGGFSLIELMVVIAVIGILMVIAIPGYAKWSADARVRATAESLANALRQTQSMAIAQGRTSMFALTTDKPPVVTSTPAANGSNWFAELNPLTADESQATLGMILKSTDASQHAVTIVGPALVCFSSLGRQSNLATNSMSTACTVGPDEIHPTTYSLKRTGAARSFNVLVYLGGRVRMCDAAKTLSSSNPDGC